MSVTILFRLKLLHFSLKNLPIASYWLRFPPQLKAFQTIFISSLSYVEVSIKNNNKTEPRKLTTIRGFCLTKFGASEGGKA